MSDKNLQMAYDIATKAGIQNLGDFDSFKKGMKNPKNLNTFYGLLQQSKVQNLGSLEEFSMRLNPDKTIWDKLGVTGKKKFDVGKAEELEKSIFEKAAKDEQQRIIKANQYPGSPFDAVTGSAPNMPSWQDMRSREYLAKEQSLEKLSHPTIREAANVGIKTIAGEPITPLGVGSAPSDVERGMHQAPRILGSLMPKKTDESKGYSFSRGVLESADSFFAPSNIMLMSGTFGAGGVTSRVFGATFGAAAAIGGVERAWEAYNAWKAGDKNKAAELAGGVLVDAFFAGLAGYHALKKGQPKPEIPEDLLWELRKAMAEDVEFEVVESKQLPQAGPEVTPRIGPRQGIPRTEQLPPAGAQPGGLPPGPGAPPRIGPRQGLPETRQLPYRAEGGPIVTPTPEGTQGTSIVPQSWMDQADRIRNFVEARNQEIIQRPPLRNEVQPSPMPPLVPPQPTGSLQKVEAAPVSVSEKPKTKKGVEVPPSVKSNIPSSYQTLYDRGFNEDQVFRMSGPGMASILERGWTAKDVSISPEGVVKYVGGKKQLPKINKEVTSSDLGIEKVGDFDTRTYDYIFNELRKGTEEAITNQVNPNEYLDYIAKESPETSKYVDKFREEMGFDVAKEYKGFREPSFESLPALVDRINSKIESIKSGKVSPPDINGAFWKAKPLLDAAWETYRKAMLPSGDFIDAILEVLPREAHPILRRWLWSAEDVSVKTFTKDSPLIDPDDVKVARYVEERWNRIDWDRYESNRQLAKIAANAVAAYNPPLMKFVKRVEVVPFEVDLLLDKTSASYDQKTGTLFLGELPSTTIKFAGEDAKNALMEAGLVEEAKKYEEGIIEEVEGEPTFSEGNINRNALLNEYVLNIAHESKHNLDKLINTSKNFKRLFKGDYVTEQKGEINARKESWKIREEAEGSRFKYLSQIADAIAEFGKGMNEILKGMFEVAGTIGAFSEESYLRAKPHFINAWKIFGQANRPFFDFKNEMIRQFGNAVVPYIDRFGMDIGLTPGPNRAMAANPQVSVSQSTIKKFGEGFMDAIDVEAPFKRQGAAKTGEAIKNWFSTRAYHEEQAIHIWGKKLRELIKENPEDMAHVVLEYENPGWADQNVAAGNRNLVKAAAQEFGRYFQESQSDYRNKGVNIDFKQRLLEDLDDLIQKSAGDPATLASLNETRNAINDMNFVHIPSSIWFTQSLLDVDPARGAKTLKLLAAKRRNTFTIKQLLEEGLIDISDVNPFHIIASYARRKGRDMAALDIVNAGKADGFVLDKNAVTGTMFRDIPGYVAPMFSRYKVHPLLADWIYDLRSADYPKTKVGRLIEQTFNYTKAAAFYNPAIMSSNNLAQAFMLGYLRSPLQWKWLGRGMKDAFTRSPEYWKALDLGVASEPMNIPFRDIYQALDKMSQFGNPKVVDMLKKMLPHNTLKSIYKLSQDITWQIDRGFRVAGYRYGVDKLGLTPAEAARLSAQYFGDYASVPPKTRRKLNKIFFTPTYKIVMGKLYARMIKGVITGAKDLWRHDKTTRVHAKALFAMLGISIAVNAVMQSAGFDIDEWGRRYTKEIDTEAGPKEEFVVTWGNPANMFTKYVARAFESAKKSDVGSTWIASFFNKNKFELHPVYQLALKLADNKNNDGDQIYSPFDATWMKAGKGLLFATTNTIRILELGEEAIRPETEGVEKKPKTFKLLSEEFGMLAALAMEPFTFNYTRGTKTDRVMKRFNYVKAKFQQEIEKGTVDPVKLKNYQKILEDIIKEESK